MFSNYFLKPRPIQNVFLIILFLTVYCIYCIFNISENASGIFILKVVLNFFLLLGTAYVLKLLLNELNLTKDSNFYAYLFIIFICFNPSFVLDINIVLSVFLSTFGMYRFLKIDFSAGSKMSIFDACLFVFTAAIFEFWVIIYSVLIVYATLRNYKRNSNIFFVPLLALLTVSILFLFFSLLISPEWTEILLKKSNVSFEYELFDNVYSRITISFYYSILFIILLLAIFQLVAKPLLVQSTIKKILFWLFLSILVYVLTSNKSNNLLIFSSIPLIILCSNFIEFSRDKILKEFVLITISILGIVFFILQTFFA